MEILGKISLEDREEIKELMARYSFAVGSGDPDGVAACFTEDGIFEGRERYLVGRQNIRQVGMDAKPDHIPRYIVTNVIIKGRANEPDVADVKCLLLSYAYRPDGPKFLTSGGYEDVVVKVNGEWLFRHRAVRPDKPVADEA
jgi:uncharacterized protein (TIGR02246 family)